MAVTFDVDGALFGTYVFYTAVLVLKVLAMAPLTARQRFSKMVTIHERHGFDGSLWGRTAEFLSGSIFGNTRGDNWL